MQIQPIDSDSVRRALDTWLQTTESDSKQLLKTVIDNISSVRTIHNVNKAVSELGMFRCHILHGTFDSKNINKKKYFLFSHRNTIKLASNFAKSPIEQ